MHTRYLYCLIGVILALFICYPPAAAQTAGAKYSNPAAGTPDGAAYWLDQGGLFATYGNYPAAIRAYKKALELAPDYSEVHFDLGVAYGELDDFDQALTSINKAIALAPDKGRYYYGRARVLLLSGRQDEARADFQKAAALGDEDAIAYLQR